MIIIILIVFLIAIAGAITMVILTLKKLNTQDGDINTVNKNAKTAQDFLPFAEIKNDALYLGNQRYRAIIETSSINYHLKTEPEKEIIEASFRAFLNGLQHPVSFFVQTKEINYSKILDSLRNDIEVTKQEAPLLADYAESYYEDVANLKHVIKSSKQKKKYIIIPFEDAAKMGELKPDEKELYSLSELDQRVEALIHGLYSIGIKGTRLYTEDIIELMYCINHRDDDAITDSIKNGEFLSTIVTSEKPSVKRDTLQSAISLLQEMENRFKFEIHSERNPEKAEELFSAISNNISDIKNGLIDVEKKGGLSHLSSDEELFDLLSSNSDEITEELKQ